MFSVAFVGPDGAGKSTVCQWLLEHSDLPLRYVYMGVNPRSSNVMFPANRLIYSIKRRLGRERLDAGMPREADRSSRRKAGVFKRMKRGARLCLLLCDEWYRQLYIWRSVRRDHVVLMDRHFYADYHAHDIDAQNRTLGQRLHGYVLKRFYPRPDVIIWLDAPLDVLWQRKPEGAQKAVASRRKEYARLCAQMDQVYRIDANQALELIGPQIELILRERWNQCCSARKENQSGSSHADSAEIVLDGQQATAPAGHH